MYIIERHLQNAKQIKNIYKIFLTNVDFYYWCICWLHIIYHVLSWKKIM